MTMRTSIILVALSSLLLNKSIVAAQATTAATTTVAVAAAVSRTTAIASTTNRITTSTITSKKTPTAALTTIFTPPSSCQTVGFTSWTSKSGSPPIYWRNAYIGANDGSTASCYPSSFRTLAQNSGYYSPGVCPSGYTVAQAAGTVSTLPSTSQCCPSTMGFDGNACISTVTTATSIWVGPGTQRAITGTWLAADWPIQVVWESEDLKDFTPASAPLSITATGATRTAAMSNGGKDLPNGVYSIDNSSSSSSGSSFSGGAIAGIVIGAIVGVVLLVVAVWFLLNMRRKRALQKNSGGFQRDYKPVMQDPSQELAGYKPEQAVNEKHRAELAANDLPLAAKINSEPVELDGGQYDLRTTGHQRVNGTTYG